MSHDIVMQIEQEAKAEMSYDAKKKQIERHRLDRAIQQIAKEKEAELAAKNFDFFSIAREKIEEMNAHDKMYHTFAKNKLPFITPKLSSIVPNHAGNLILIGAKTNAGKSTATANIAAEIIKDKSKKVLIISGEEMASAVYNRIACLEQGLNVSRFAEFTEEQRISLAERKFSLAEQVVVFDFSASVPHLTTSIEGVEFITNNLLIKLNEGKKYDVIILDYFQKVSTSTRSPDASTYSVLEQLTNVLDRFKNLYPAPLIVFAQLKPEAKDAEFEDRIKFCKNILVVSTFALEMRVDYERKITTFVPQKARYGAENILNNNIEVVFMGGRYQDITPQTDPANANFKPLNF